MNKLADSLARIALKAKMSQFGGIMLPFVAKLVYLFCKWFIIFHILSKKKKLLVVILKNYY